MRVCMRVFYTHSKQLHGYWNRYFFTQVCIEFLREDETNDSDDAHHKSANVCFWNEVAHLQNGLEKGPQKRRKLHIHPRKQKLILDSLREDSSTGVSSLSRNVHMSQQQHLLLLLWAMCCTTATFSYDSSLVLKTMQCQVEWIHPPSSLALCVKSYR